MLNRPERLRNLSASDSSFGENDTATEGRSGSPILLCRRRAVMSDLTHVELLWLEKRIENWIRFGHAAEEQILDRRRRILSFAPGSIFAFVRWTSNDFGTIVSRIDILRAVAPGSELRNCALCAARRPRSCCGCPVGPRSNACCRLSMPSRRSASTRLTPHLTIGTTSTIVCPSTKCRGFTRSARHQAWLHRRKDRAVTGRLATLLTTLGAATVLLSTIAAKPVPRYLWNASRSAPIGLYELQPNGKLAVTRLVAVRPPEPLATFLADRRYLPRGVPLLKRVLGAFWADSLPRSTRRHGRQDRDGCGARA